MSVRIKDLCADAAVPEAVAEFWAGLLGLDAELLPDGDAVLRAGGVPWLWVNRVSDPKVVKNRVHLDLAVPGREVPGARRLAEFDVFTVYADPEGNEFCAFEGDGAVDGLRAGPRAIGLCTDAADPVADAAWWAQRTGARIVPGPDGAPRYLEDVPGLGMTWKFVPVDDPRTVKNRWHWDVYGEVPGAEVRDRRPDWTVLADPAGNEFCAFPEPDE
ncbi:VOC family protein [Pseudonocardia ailaonensis]|uniref:VOC family protein n=1 Tax=Pseudonocardia ailaonensis TaxID=367279 RepID=A0ABN2ND55_9PSEU